MRLCTHCNTVVRRSLVPLASIAAALEFLTPLHVHGPDPFPDSVVGRSSACFPFVGLLIGLALVGIDRFASAGLPGSVVNALLIVFLAVATGGLHLDGLADSADGLLGGRNPERRLEIMRDSRIGSFGAIAIALAILVLFSALVSLLPPWREPGLLLFPILGRAAMVAALAAFPYARPQGLGVVFHRYVHPGPLLVAEFSSLALAVICFGGSGTALWGASQLAALALGAGMTRGLGGLTGDCYGAICELTQILVLILVVSAHRVGWLLPWLIRG